MFKNSLGNNECENGEARARGQGAGALWVKGFQQWEAREPLPESVPTSGSMGTGLWGTHLFTTVLVQTLSPPPFPLFLLASILSLAKGTTDFKVGRELRNDLVQAPILLITKQRPTGPISQRRSHISTCSRALKPPAAASFCELTSWFSLFFSLQG